MKLLEPLSEATDRLCGSKYPTLNSSLAVYIVLIQHLHASRQGLYDQAQLIRPAELMIKKINQYLEEAIKKPMYICAMILDPKFKTTFWTNHQDFIVKHYKVSVDEITKTFKNIAQDFFEKLPKKKDNISARAPQPCDSKAVDAFDQAMYQPDPMIEGVQKEIATYLKEGIETKSVQVLHYWASRRNSLPTLALMARRYLCIPATSASS
ncbi:hypothetical protein PCANC_18194 [Puccinia coronata f. sp. avenae]|uniref:HAT C-terminal dimerisation domain-containing protein n=1 Tax=Puccinia coronata f. sp. avenae TaxID=200324 RepID=A0A2N5SJW6_9BASI|nr:hypothetical protein PCANC_18194 [Puccinia coronata f. sp. avenae]